MSTKDTKAQEPTDDGALPQSSKPSHIRLRAKSLDSAGLAMAGFQGGNRTSDVHRPGRSISSRDLREFHRGPSMRTISSTDNAGFSDQGFVELYRNIWRHRHYDDDKAPGVDLGTLRRLTKEDKVAEEEHLLIETAQYMSIRQTAAVSIAVFALVTTIVVVTLVFVAGNSVAEGFLFAFYTSTTAGFGSVKIPKTPGFLFFAIVYMFVGIMLTTILASQAFQYSALRSRQASRQGDQLELAHRGLETLHLDNDDKLTPVAQRLETIQRAHDRDRLRLGNYGLKVLKSLKKFYRRSELNRFLCFSAYLVSLLLVGAIVMLALEGWTFWQAFYFATFCMTTVGYGDYYPTSNASTWFVVFWLPFNISFLSIFMGNLGRYWMMVSDWQFGRNLKQLQAKQAPMDLSIQFNTDKDTSLSIQEQSAITTMKDVVDFVIHSLAEDVCMISEGPANPVSSIGALSETFMLQSSLGHSTTFEKNGVRQPSFALMVLVQERFANIIANEVAGFRSKFEVKEMTVAVTVDVLQDVAEKWRFPSGAHQSFRIAAFEILLNVGEKKLVTEGADALLKLSPFEFHRIFSPLLAAYADAGTMEGWLALTEAMADEHFPRVMV